MYTYNNRLFEEHLFNESLPSAFRNTSLHRRAKNGICKKPLSDIGGHDVEEVEIIDIKNRKMDEYLTEIASRWNIVSPRYCIGCLEIVEENEYLCSKCGASLGDVERIRELKAKGNYIEPQFDNLDMKWTSKIHETYLNSLAPSIGEFQLEYRERLKWEFAEINYIKLGLKNMMDWIIRSNSIKRSRLSQNPRFNGKAIGGEWDVYAMTQDAWERKMWEDTEVRNEQTVEHWKEFWGD